MIRPKQHSEQHAKQPSLTSTKAQPAAPDSSLIKSKHRFS